MECLRAKLAVVTGASSGIGAAIVLELLAAQLTVVGLARRVERVVDLKQQLPANRADRLHAQRCDVTNAADVAAVFGTIVAKHGPIHVLVNSAGCLRTGQLCSMAGDQVEAVLQTNVMGVVNCTRHAFASMQTHNMDGHIVLINSIVGHKVPVLPGRLPALNIYPATKFALTAINEIYRQEFRALGTRVKVTSISPGLVDTELITAEQKGVCAGSILQPVDVARAVMFVLTSPAHVHVCEMIIKPTGDPI